MGVGLCMFVFVSVVVSSCMHVRPPVTDGDGVGNGCAPLCASVVHFTGYHNATGPPMGSVARIPARQGRYFVGVAADIANFEYDDFPFATTRQFLSCCNSSAPPTFSLSVELQDAGTSCRRLGVMLSGGLVLFWV